MRADERLEDDERDWLEGRRRQDQDPCCAFCGGALEGGCGCTFDRTAPLTHTPGPVRFLQGPR